MRTLSKQLKSSQLLIFINLLVAITLIGISIAIHIWKEVDIALFVRELHDICKYPPYVSSLSQIGILCWSASAAIYVFSYNLLSKGTVNHSIGKLKNLIIGFSLLTIYLDLDDTFQLHEKVLPSIGLYQNYIIFSYILAVFLFFLKSFSYLSKTDYILLLISLFSFGISIALDVFPTIKFNIFIVDILDTLHDEHYSVYAFIEDVCKLIGILFWLAYAFRLCQMSVCLKFNQNQT
jgi:hypothetical protein